MTNIFFDDEPNEPKESKPKEDKATNHLKKPRSFLRKMGVICILLIALFLILTITFSLFRSNAIIVHTQTEYVTIQTVTIASTSTCIVQAVTANNHTYYYSVQTVTSGTYYTTANHLVIFENNTLVNPC